MLYKAYGKFSIEYRTNIVNRKVTVGKQMADKVDKNSCIGCA